MGKIVIFGTRTYDDYDGFVAVMDQYQEITPTEHFVDELIVGGCRGTDSLAERWARERGIPVKVYKADWEKYGKSAGPRRNEEMAKDADFGVCFWDGKSRGTRNMIGLMKGRIALGMVVGDADGEQEVVFG